MTELRRTVLEADELEALRLCDLEDLTQEEAGKRMGVSRGTVQRIIYSARKKVILAIIEGQALILEPGNTEEKT